MENKEIELEFSMKDGAPAKHRGACCVVGVFADKVLTAPAQALDDASGGAISAMLKHGDHEGRAGAAQMLYGLENVAAERVLVVGLGKADAFNEKAYREAVTGAVKALSLSGATDALVTLTEAPVVGRSVEWAIEQAATLAFDALYRFDMLKSDAKRPAKPLKKLSFSAAKADAKANAALAKGRAIGLGMTLAKNLGNTPSNICTPEFLAKQAQKLAKTYGFGVEILDAKACEKLGMGSFLSVGKGSANPPRFIVLKHMAGKKTDKPVVLVGKAITFDTGGISLKPGPDMDEMQYDMSGGGAVLGAFRALGELGLKMNVVGLIAAAENMPDASASKPGDVVKSMSGLTIEILNTDAEGRLVLCDALTYAEKFKPACVVDMATLTGACVIGLGHHPAALFASDDALAAELQNAANAAWDRVWRMPLWDDYQEQLKSSLADMANIGGRPGGTITAACFLWRFAKAYPWAHLDIAGVAYKGGRDKGSTGRPVPLLVNFLAARAG